MMHGRLTIGLKMVLLALALGIASWMLSDYVLTSSLHQVMENNYLELVHKDATETRMRADNHIREYFTSAKLLITQKRFLDYISMREEHGWAEDKDADVINYMSPPEWFPDPSVSRVFVPARFFILQDPKHRIREIYSTLDHIPQGLMSTSSDLFILSQNQSFITSQEGIPYIISSRSVLGPNDELRALLTIGSPIDDAFLVESQSITASKNLIALVTVEPLMIVASNRNDLIPVGTLVDSLMDRYLVVDEPIFDYGNSDLLLKLATFVPRKQIAGITESLTLPIRKDHLITSSAFFLSFFIFIFLVTRRIKRLTARVVSFRHEALGVPDEKMQGKHGDEIVILDKVFKDLSSEVIQSHEIIRKDAEQETRLIVENAFDAVIACDAESVITTWNMAAERMFGWSKDEAVGLSLTETIIPARYIDIHNKGIRHFIDEGERETQKKHIELTALRRDGSEFPIDISVTSARAGKGAFKFFAIIRDIAERKKLEEQLAHSQKMQAIGLLTGGVAHDFNNFLTTIMGYSELLSDKLSDDEMLKHYIDNIMASCERANYLTQSLLQFGRKQALHPVPVDINDVIRNFWKLLARLIGEDITIVLRLSENPIVVNADAGKIEQVLMNLGTNARDAMPKGGRLYISTEGITLDENFVSIHAYGTPGDYALITVTDTGRGMDADTKRQIFEPYFTTKEVGRGTGLGLSVVYGIVKQHGGEIFVYSEPEEGTTFKIYIPLLHEAAEERRKVEPTAVGMGEGTILLAEDDDNVRDLLKLVLEKYGYTVTEVTNGEDAVEVFRQRANEIDLLLFDVLMPKMNGADAYREIQKIKGDVNVLFISGYPSDVLDRKGLIKNGFHYISKPVAPFDLIRKVHAILEDERSAGFPTKHAEDE